MLAISLFAMGRLIVDQAGAIATELPAQRPDLAALAFGAILGSTLLGGVFWRVVLSAAGVELRLGDAMRSWCLSAPTKYGLGALSQYASRVYLVERKGVPRSRAVAGLALEVAVIVLSGVVVLLSAAPLAGDLVVPGAPLALRLLGLPAGAAVAVALPALVRAAAGLARPGPAEERAALAGDRLRLALLLVVVNWLLLGLGAFCLAATMAEAEPASYPAFVVAVTAATLAGMLAFTPLGLGVREVTMAVLLAQVVPAPVATSVALLHRLLGVVAELLAAGAALALSARRQGGAGRNR